MPSPTNPILIIPKNDLTALSLTSYTVADTGVWTPSATLAGLSLLSYIDSIELNVLQRCVESMSTDSPFENNIPVATSFEISISEKWRRAYAGSYSPVLPEIATASPYFGLTWTLKNKGTGATDLHQTWVAYCVWDALTPAIRGAKDQMIGLHAIQSDVSYGNSGLVPLSYTVS